VASSLALLLPPKVG